MKEKNEMYELSENQKKFLDVFTLQRFHSIISNLAEVGLMTNNFIEVKRSDWEPLKDSENNEEFYQKVMEYHSNRADNLWEEGQKISPEVFHKLGDFLFNKELKLAQDFSEWALDSYKPFGEPIKSFDWEKYLNKKICEVIHEIH